MPWKCRNVDYNISLSITGGLDLSGSDTISRKVTKSYFSVHSVVSVTISSVLVEVVLGILSSATAPGMSSLYGQGISPEY